MKLPEGVYENLISNELQSRIEESRDLGMVCESDRIDDAESPSMLARYLSGIIQRRLEMGDLSIDEQKNFVNQIIEFATADGSNSSALTDAENMLTSVESSQSQASQSITLKKVKRPLSGFRVSNLFTGGQSALSLESEIQRDIASADHICLIVSFLRLSGIRLIIDDLRRFCGIEGHSLKIITTTYCGATEAKAVEQLAHLPRTSIKISYNTKIERLHAKSYIFLRNSGLSSAYIGSSNLSKSAQTDGLEWNIRVTNVENPHIIKTAIATFEQYWNSDNFEDFREGGIEKFNKEMKREKRLQKGHVPQFQAYSILPHQKAILDKLAIEREVNNNYKNLVVAATGTGKTVVSAFDYHFFAQNNEQRSHRLLFVAHRKEILEQSLRTYRSVLRDENFGDLMVDGITPSQTEHLFASVQSFNSKFSDCFSKFSPDYYDYIVIDEAHHSQANTYRQIFGHFKPKVLLGLTATPERMDGQSLLPDFGYKISADIRLPQALDEGLLTPFQYLCITDPTDLKDANLWSGGVNGKYLTSKLSERLCTAQRTALIAERLHHYLPNEHACRALCFCTDKAHADFTASELRKLGFKAESLTSDCDSATRELRRQQLERRAINYLCVVDMFNEGIDIRQVDTVLFLRPTESITVFLQQLGRGLRLSPGKQLLTVLDFVSQVNRNYDFASRFRSLMKRTNRRLIDEIQDGFTALPFGCSIMMEEKTKEFVVESIKAAVFNKTRLIREIQSYASCPTLTQFLADTGIDIRIIYNNNKCWTSLKALAGKCSFAASTPIAKKFVKGIGNLVHCNSANYLKFIAKMCNEGFVYDNSDATQNTYALMLYYALFQDKLQNLAFESMGQAFAVLSEYPMLVGEIKELVAYLLSELKIKTFAIGEEFPEALEQYGCYTREEVFSILGLQTIDKTMRGVVSGVVKAEKYNAEILFVTLNKSDKDFSASTQYNDYVICDNKFHWQSQNTDSHGGSGARFVNQRINGKKFILFVREQKYDGFGNTCPFYCFGLVDYVTSSGDRPMNIEWKLQQPVLPMFLKAI